MENYPFNSLKNQLIENGILDNGVSDSSIEYENFFNHKELNNSNSKENTENNHELVATRPEINDRKRLNRFEFETEAIKVSKDNNIISLLKNKKLSKSEKFLIRFFPKIYKARLAKDALKKFGELGIDTRELLDKTIPYGEEELRYEDLIKYIKYANEIEIGINKKFN